MHFSGGDGNSAVVGINEKAIENGLTFAGYNLLVTSETNIKDTEIYEIYHNLWRIEETFKIMKSDLDARPVYLQKEETMKLIIIHSEICDQIIFQFKTCFFSLSQLFGKPGINMQRHKSV